MAVRIKVRIKSNKKEIETVALINSGFETEEPEIALPKNLAQRLGLWPTFPEGTTIEKYEVAGGEKFDFYFIKHGVVVETIPKGRATLTNAVIMGEREVLIGDKLASAQRIVMVDIGKGLWRFKGEKRNRRSLPPEYW
jgi:hypothetical protein